MVSSCYNITAFILCYSDGIHSQARIATTDLAVFGPGSVLGETEVVLDDSDTRELSMQATEPLEVSTVVLLSYYACVFILDLNAGQGVADKYR